MKRFFLSAAIVASAGTVFAQASPPANDADLAGLTTPLVLGKDKGTVGLQFNSFGGSGKLLRTGLSLGYGFGRGWEVDLAGTFAGDDSFGLVSPAFIKYGGSAGDVLIKYRLPVSFDASLQAGLGYSNTPAQTDKNLALLGASAGYSVVKGFRVYVNPKFVALSDNSLFGVGFGAVYEITPGISVYGDWTPLFNGDNTLSTIDGSRKRVQLYAVGVRIARLSPGLALDLGYTNTTGQTTGFSLTPSLGNTGGLYVGLAYRF